VPSYCTGGAVADKPSRAAEYSGEQLGLVRSACLYVATKLGDLLDDVVIVGGLVPSLLIEQSRLPEGASAHVGTSDLDLGLEIALLDEGRYRTFTERLRDAGFAPDRTEDGRETRQRWQAPRPCSVTVDFVIAPSQEADQGGKLRHIDRDFAAIIAPGLELAFRDRRRVRIEGTTIFGERAARDVWVCGPGAFVVLKALAFLGRGGNKDAYDLYYLVRYFGAGVEDVAVALRPLLADPEAQRAVAMLRADFFDPDSLGPRRVAEFLYGRPDVEIQADVVGFVRALLDRLAPPPATWSPGSALTADG
jgi:hypothetical protein